MNYRCDCFQSLNVRASVVYLSQVIYVAMATGSVKGKAVVFFSQAPMLSLVPDKGIARIAGDMTVAAKLHRAVILDLLSFFDPKQTEYDFFYSYKPFTRGQRINFLQLKDTHKLHVKSFFPQEKHEQPVSMAITALKMLEKGYSEVLVVRPMACASQYRDILPVFSLLASFDMCLWRQENSALGVFAVKKGPHVDTLLTKILPCTASKFFTDIKSCPEVLVKEISPPLHPADDLFQYSPAQIAQYFPELSQFHTLVSSLRS